MGFELSSEQRELRDWAHEFAVREMRPVAGEYDEKEEMPWDVLQKAYDAGLMTYGIPEEYGGGGITETVTYVLIQEELFWGCAGIGTAIGASGLAASPIIVAGTDEQKRRFLPLFTAPGKPKLGAFALTEPQAGSDVSSLSTTAVRKGDHYVLNGQKRFISNGGIADVYVVFATVDKSRGHEGITAFVVPGDTPGIVAGKKEKKMGIRASHTGDVIFEDVELSVENRLGEEGQGFLIAMKVFEHTRPGVGAGAVGIARAAYEYALQYANERVQFGKPIISKQAIRFLLADMATQIDAARLLVWRAAWMNDQGLPVNKEASMAKAFASDVAMRATTDAVQILGGYGYMRDYPVEKWMRDAKITQIYEGTSQIQRVIISQMLAMGM
ncbi:MAG: acyl-CoA dehydrogenase [Chloroflexi bacterium]|nr:acyl-CoA dehydrogenase [Chloroflexota bacterium]